MWYPGQNTPKFGGAINVQSQSPKHMDLFHFTPKDYIDILFGIIMFRKPMESKCGRYASSSLTISGNVIIAGGMTICNADHKVQIIIETFYTNTFDPR